MFSDQIPKAFEVEELPRHFTVDCATRFVYMHKTVFHMLYLLTSSAIKAENSLSALVKVAIIFTSLFTLLLKEEYQAAEISR